MTRDERVYGAARWLAGRGIRDGSRVALDVPDVLPWFLGADLLGAATLVVEPSWTPRERAAVLADAQPDLVVSGVAAPAGEPLERAGTGETFFYLPTTSGSSGSPKVLVRTRDSWVRSFEALGALPGPVLVPGPLSSSLFLFGALHGRWCGREVRTLPRWDPEAAAGVGAATVHLVPAMLSALLAVLERRAEPSPLRTVVCGGAHLGDDVRARFAAVLPRAELIEYYGSAEHSLIAVRRGGDGLRPVPGVDLDVRDGVLWVRSPLACSGRLRDGRLVPAGEWSTVGDLVSFSASGALTVRGRAGAVVSSGGRLVPAEEVEAVLRTAPGVADVLVTGTPHPRLGELVTAVVEGDVRLRELRAVARAALAPANRPRRWLVAKELPRTASGKPARALIAEQLAAGTLPAEPLT
ncbi:class I adenylate-forming enzyme family protein [Amycolatopsis thermophila]|uniref:Long-chain acyl-CoA synthetase n=1 Tax=Amycolatopsis thermophila TaxID=206084 RepID=A0ABU0F394_9PSEU|nr:AMP-binding protein [Amycolatopsis thermophila]MDQ0382049.1 long-chain acyl-CoA synthetase [Amycolatopsis thermophila]